MSLLGLRFTDGSTSQIVQVKLHEAHVNTGSCPKCICPSLFEKKQALAVMHATTMAMKSVQWACSSIKSHQSPRRKCGCFGSCAPDTPHSHRGNISCSYLHANHIPERACNIKLHLHLDSHLFVNLCEHAHSSGLECSNRCRQMCREYHLADVKSAQISIIINTHKPKKIAVSGKADTTIYKFCGVQGLPFSPCHAGQMQRSVCNSSSV